MQIFRSRIAVSLAALAACSVVSSPVLAHGRDHWRPYRHYHGGGIGTGGLLAGLLVIGGAAAIATKVSQDNADRRGAEPAPYRYPEGAETDRDAEYDQVPPDEGGAAYPGGPVQGDELDDRQNDAREQFEPAAGSIGAAVDVCETELERGDRRIESVGSARRIGDRYSVEGRLQDGRPFACSVDDSGHVRSMAVDGHGMI